MKSPPIWTKRREAQFWNAAKLLGRRGSFASRRPLYGGATVLQVVVPGDLARFECLAIDGPVLERLIADGYLEPLSVPSRGGERWLSRSVRD